MGDKQYSKLAKYYDKIIGDRNATVELIENLILENNPNAKNILELACGTGAVLKPFSKIYDVYGLDLSKEMISLARKNVPKAKLFNVSMTKFNLNKKFGVILCLFDSINHLISFSDWEKVFVNVEKHLDENGIFIFDINTISKLETLAESKPQLIQLDNNFAIMSVNKLSKNLVNWDVKIFEKDSKSIYSLLQDNIKEKSFPVDKIIKTLSIRFRQVTAFDSNKILFSDESKRVYFVCKK